MTILTPHSRPISPILVSPNGRHFVDRAGNPAFWLGDTQWEMFRLFNPQDARRILKDRQAKGFNVILIMLTGVETGLVDPTLSAPYVNLEGESPWLDGDPLKPNEKYFRRIDSMIRLGEETGQTFVVGVYHKWHTRINPLEKCRGWARWVANRYRDVPNLIWSMYPTASDEYVPICRELAAGLQEGDGGAHLICVHPDPSVASSSFIHNEPWLAFNMIQTCVDYDHIYEAVTADYRRTPVKPVVMAEGGYEGLEFEKVQTSHIIRKQAYWTQLAGGYHVYGHNDCWTSPRTWEQWIQAPGSVDLRTFKEIITGCDHWWQMIPDQSLFQSGAGSGFGLNVAVRASAGNWLLAYLSEPASASLRLEVASACGQARASWINPVSGDRQPAGSYPAGSIQSFTSPQRWEDALLLVEDM